MAIVAFPPMIHGGWVYTWGSGYHGQLGRGSDVYTPLPEVVDYFFQVHLLVRSISSGSHHCAAVTCEGELYTWGSNKNSCLGR
jgi:alpha-tubulin suppressor-like RCC1 family protein